MINQNVKGTSGRFALRVIRERSIFLVIGFFQGFRFSK